MKILGILLIAGVVVFLFARIEFVVTIPRWFRKH